MKTASQVQSDVIALLENSPLSRAVTGSIYRGTPESSYRPRDSKKEDIVVIFTAGETGEIQSGVVTIQIYVPDVAPYSNGVYLEDGARTAQLQNAAQSWVAALTLMRTQYLFKQRGAIYSVPQHEIQQHYIVVKLHYQLYEEP